MHLASAASYNLMKIAIPKEIMHEETRVSLVPDSVAKLLSQNNEVIIETGAGEQAAWLNYPASPVTLSKPRAACPEARRICFHLRRATPRIRQMLCIHTTAC